MSDLTGPTEAALAPEDELLRIAHLRELGRVADALERARSLAGRWPSDVDVLTELASCLALVDDLVGAEAAIQAGLAVSPDDVEAQSCSLYIAINRARQTDKRRERRRLAREAVRRADLLGPVSPTDAGIAYLTSRAHATARRWQDAGRAASEAMRISPNGVWGPLAQAELARDRFRHRQARRHVAEALRREPEHPHAQVVGAAVARDPVSRVRHLRAAARAGDRNAAADASSLLEHLTRPYAAVWPTVLTAFGLSVLNDLSRGPWWVYVIVLAGAWVGIRTIATRLRSRALAELPPSGRALVLRPGIGGAVKAVMGCLVAVAMAFSGGWPLTPEAVLAQAEEHADREADRRDPVPIVVQNEAGIPVIHWEPDRPEPDVIRVYTIRAYLLGASGVFATMGLVVVIDARRLRRRGTDELDRSSYQSCE